MPKLKVPSEEWEQERLAEWLDSRLPQNTWCHVPNGGFRSKVTAAKMKRAGLKAGVPDILIFVPHRTRSLLPGAYYVGIAIELKRTKGGTTSDAQETWLASLKNAGWSVAVCRGHREAIEFVRSSLGNLLAQEG